MLREKLLSWATLFLIVLGSPLLAAPPRDRTQVPDRDRVRDIDRHHDDDCLRAGIFRSPDLLMAGDHFTMVVGVQNLCRHIALVEVDIYLAQEDFRVHIGSGQLVLDGPEAELLYLRPRVPRDMHAGRYSLVMVARARGGSLVLDRTAVFVKNRHRPRPHVRPDHLDFLSDGGSMDSLKGELGSAGPQLLSEEATGSITHLSRIRIKVEQRVGSTTPFLTIDANTVIVDEAGNPTTVNKTDQVTVYYTGKHADKIVVLD